MQKKQIMDKDSGKQTNRVYIVFAVMVAIQLASIIYCFQFKKEGWHSDEIWSYGYANSYYQKDIYVDKDGNPMNYGEWVDGSVLWDYLVVNKGEQFEYGSIYQNQINDLSPPLHSMILHTVCSFFPETFSFWYSFVINIVAFIVSMVYLFKLTRLLKGDWFALSCCAVYGFSLGARDTFIYLRMYAMCTALVMVILYNLLVYMKAKEKRMFNKNLVAISATAFIGFLTNYYMIAFMGILTFLVCIYYLFQRRIKQMFVFGGCQLFVLFLSIGVFPALLNMAQNHNTQIAEGASAGMNYNFEMRFRILANFITMKLYGIPVSLYRSGRLKIILVCVIVGIIWMLPLAYLLRDTKLVLWFKRRISFFEKNMTKIARWILRRVNWYYVILCVLIPCQIIVVGETSNVYTMADYEDRYLMYLYPVALIVVMAFLYLISIILFRRRKIGKAIVLISCMVLCVVNMRNRGIYKEYYFPSAIQGMDLEKCVKDMKCIYVERNCWLLTAMAPILKNSQYFFMCTPEDYEQYIEEYMKKCKEDKVLLIIDKSFVKIPLSTNNSDGVVVLEEDEEALESQRKYNDMLDFFEDIEANSEMKWISTQVVFSRPMEVYVINP